MAITVNIPRPSPASRCAQGDLNLCFISFRCDAAESAFGFKKFDQCDPESFRGYSSTNGDAKRSRCSKREDRQSGGRTWRRDQNQTPRGGGGGKSEYCVAQFPGRGIRN